MTKILRRTGHLALVLLIGAFTMLGAASPVMAQDDDCYPVPPGGCAETAETPTCADILEAIATDDTSLDQNGDGVIDAADLPADCGCAELLDAIAAGTIAVEDLPPDALADCTCAELLDAVAAGTLSLGDLPEGALADCTCEELLDAVTAGTIALEDIPAGALADCGCEEIVAAIVAGAIDPSDLPEDLADELLAQISTCCAEIADAVIAGDIDAASLPDGVLEACDCDTLQELVDAGVLEASVLDDCDGGSGDVEGDEPSEEEIIPAATGADGTGLAALTGVALLAGTGLLLATRRRTT